MKTHLDLFSGIGGFALAANWAGYQTIGFCEIEDYPRRILSKRFPGIPVHRDVRELDGSQYTGCDLITGGYPCQPFSQAGQRRGAADDRHLWPEMYRIIKQARPASIVAENVAGHITLGLDEVLADLESEGYATRTLVLPACAKNAPHRRDRCWVIAKSLADTKQQGLQGYAEQQTKPSDAPAGCGTSAAVADTSIGRGSRNELQTRRNESGLCGTDVADTGHEQPPRRDEVTERQQSCGRWSPRGQSTPRGSSNPAPTVADTDCERRRLRDTERENATDAGQSSRSTQHRARDTQPGLGGAVDGLPGGLDMPRRWADGSWENGTPRVTTSKTNRTQRLKALGNAIVPQIAYEILKELERHE